MFLLAVVGFESGVGVSERAEFVGAGLAAHAYYALGLFVVGGLDLGLPQGGPPWGQLIVWVAYFGAPALTASAVIETVLRFISPQAWVLRRLREHYVLIGSGDLTTSYLRVLRARDKRAKVVVIDSKIDSGREQELVEGFKAIVLKGDVTQPFMLNALRLHRVREDSAVR